MRNDNEGRDEFHYILDETHVEIRNIAELEAAAGKARTTIWERCSRQEVEFSAYKAARNRCVRDIMEELGRNPMFNDILDVVVATRMVRPDLNIIMKDRPDVSEVGGAHFIWRPQPKPIESIIRNIYDYIAGNINDLEFTSHAGDTEFGADNGRDWLRGAVIHEFTHFAMYTVFKNDCNPYFSSTAHEQFTGIMLQTMRNLYVHYLPDKPLSHDLTVEEMAKAIGSLIDPRLRTFSYMFLIPDTYSPHTYNREFVVRLPEILAEFYNGDNYMLPSELQACFEPLISYWKDFITPEMRKFLDRHPKGHLVTVDRVYEENILAHSGEHYLLLEGRKTPANAALAGKAQALIAEIGDNNIQEFNRIIEAASDDRLPRIALAQAIEHNKPEIFEVAFAKIKHPQYLGSLLIKAIENGQYSMAEQIQPHIKDQYFISTAIMAFTGHEGGNELFNTLVSISQENGQSFGHLLARAEKAGKSALCDKLLLRYDKDALKLMEMLFRTRKNAGLQKLLMEKLLSMDAKLIDNAINEAADINKSEYLDTFFNVLKVKPESEYLSAVLQIKNPLLMEKAFADAVKTPGREKMFEQMLPYMGKHPQYMEKALDIAAEHNKSEMFVQMLPYMVKEPQYMGRAFEAAVLYNRSEMFEQMLSYMTKEPQHMEKAFIGATYSKPEVFAQMLPYMVKEPQYMERAFEITAEFDKAEMFEQMLPYIAKYPQYMKAAFNTAIDCDKFEMFAQMLPYMAKEPQYMRESFIKVANTWEKKEMLEQMLPYLAEIGVEPKDMEEAFKNAIYYSQLEMFTQILPFIAKEPQYMGEAFISAIYGNRPEMFAQMLPYMAKEPQYMEEAFIVATHYDKPEMLAQVLSGMVKEPKYMERAFEVTVDIGKPEMFAQMLPYMAKEPQYMRAAFNTAIDCDKFEMFEQMLPYIAKEPQYMRESFIKVANIWEKKEMFEQMLPYLAEIGVEPKDMEKAFKNAIYYSQLEMFTQILPFIAKEPQYMGEAFISAIYDDRPEMFAQMLPYMVKEPQYMKEAFIAATHYDKPEMFAQMLPYMVKEPQYMERAFEITVDSDKPEMFAQMLPYMAKEPQYMREAFNTAIYGDRSKMFAQMLPHIAKEPQYMERAFALAIYLDKVGVFKQLIQSVKNDLPYINSELPYIGFKIESIVKIAADDAEIFVELLSKGARNNHDLVAKLKEELPAALANPAFKQQAIAAATALGNQDILSLITASAPQPVKAGQGETLFSNLDFLPNFPGAAAASASDMRPLPPPLSFSDLPPVIPELQSVFHPLPVAAIAPSAESQSTAMAEVSSAVTSYSGVAEAAFLTAGARYFYTTAMNIGDSMFGTPAPVKAVAKTHRLLEKQYDVMMAEIEEIRESIRPRREEIQIRLGALERQPLLNNNEIKEKKSLTIEASVLQGISYKCIEAKFALDEVMEKMTTPQLTVRGLSKIKETLKQVKTDIAAMQKQVAEPVQPKSHAEKAGKKPVRTLEELKRQKPTKHSAAAQDDGGFTR